MNKFFAKWKKILCLILVMSLLAVPVRAEPMQNQGETQKIASSYYQIDGGFIRGIAPGTTGQKLQKVCSPRGVKVPEAMLVTGDKISLGNESLTVIITADLNGDGKVSITDLLMCKSHLLGTPLEENAALAADVNYDGKVSITDFLRIKSNLLGLEQITAGRTAESQEPLLLLAPGQTVNWTVDDGASYRIDDPSVATVDATGKVTALEQEGTARLWALDAGGNEIASSLVTVLGEALTVSVGQKNMHLIMGNSKAIQAHLNHPVQAKITWSSSDTNVATVSEDGRVNGIKPGFAVITAALENGSSAQVELTVASPITAVQTERILYKVKPGATKKINLIQNPADAEESYTWTSSDPSIATVSNDGTVTGIQYGTVTIYAKGLYSGLTAQCSLKVCDVKQVAITFDDGPSNITPQLLDFCKENDIRVTFFLVGNRMDSFSSYVIREAAEGHEIGYHSYAHIEQTTLSSERIKSDFDKANNRLKELTGQEFTVWRTPGGGFNTRVLEAVPLPHIMWSVDTLDWKHRNSYSVYRSVVNARDGSIILMHDLYSSTATGAIQAMKEMLAGDYEFLTVTELLSRDGTPPQPSVSYTNAPKRP